MYTTARNTIDNDLLREKCIEEGGGRTRERSGEGRKLNEGGCKLLDVGGGRGGLWEGKVKGGSQGGLAGRL